ncbi:hypothetical protein RM156_23095 (plasmid) [Pantoea agglomerans]|uniref:hypothetical protein n=1 Tax=Enterobacter agglomerans TaxID=549 RepID=UPI0028995AC5|nr:hypothetical protein [Pantoea agglomerans]WNK69555.1 hypothetical protein RM156_23095 [Pantoea agglomerans]
MTNSDGGPAFPVGTGIGMTLRDYFAAQVIQGLVSGYALNKNIHQSVVTTFAEQAYRVADEMIKARK